MLQNSGGGDFYWGKVNGKRVEGEERPASGNRNSRREERKRQRNKRAERKRKRWEVGRAFIKVNVVNVYRRCS